MPSGNMKITTTPSIIRASNDILTIWSPTKKKRDRHQEKKLVRLLPPAYRASKGDLNDSYNSIDYWKPMGRQSLSEGVLQGRRRVAQDDWRFGREASDAPPTRRLRFGRWATLSSVLSSTTRLRAQTTMALLTRRRTGGPFAVRPANASNSAIGGGGESGGLSAVAMDSCGNEETNAGGPARKRGATSIVSVEVPNTDVDPAANAPSS
ncbi:hypothetical protein BGZ79_011134 [Entomortierella chlamydospora]|nr:hypothetical protein BGZ79_011134 [Entomortierella chlamydospora]